MDFYGNEKWSEVIHAGIYKNTGFILFKEGHNININEVMDIEGVSRVYVIKHLWKVVIIELEKFDNIEELIKRGFKIGIKTNKKYKFLNNGFYKIGEL